MFDSISITTPDKNYLSCAHLLRLALFLVPPLQEKTEADEQKECSPHQTISRSISYSPAVCCVVDIDPNEDK
jgi:hypothetical protein